MKKFLGAAIVTAGFLAFTPAQAEQVFGTASSTNAPEQIYTADPDTGATTLVCSFDSELLAPVDGGPDEANNNSNSPNGLAYDQANNRLYFSVTVPPGDDPDGSNLYFCVPNATTPTQVPTLAGQLVGEAAGAVWVDDQYLYVRNADPANTDLQAVSFNGAGIKTGEATLIEDLLSGVAPPPDTAQLRFGDLAQACEGGLIYGSSLDGNGFGAFFSIDLDTDTFTVIGREEDTDDRTGIQLAFTTSGRLIGHSTGSGEFFDVDLGPGGTTTATGGMSKPVEDRGFTDLGETCVDDIVKRITSGPDLPNSLLEQTNRITDGDFESVVSLTEDFLWTAGTDAIDEWFTNNAGANYQINNTDSSSSNYAQQHTINNGHRLLQVVDISGLGLGPTSPVQANFDYILECGFAGSVGSGSITLVGLNMGESIGLFAGDPIGGTTIATEVLSASVDGFTSESIIDTLGGSFDYLAVLFRFGGPQAFSGTGTCERGVDNVSLFLGDDAPDGEIDVVVEAPHPESLYYDFTITVDTSVTGVGTVHDDVPGEWDIWKVNEEFVVSIDPDGNPGDEGPPDMVNEVDPNYEDPVNFDRLECGESGTFGDDMDSIDGDATLMRGGKNKDPKGPTAIARGDACQSSTKIWWDLSDEAEAIYELTVHLQSRPKNVAQPFFSPTSCGALFLNEGAFIGDFFTEPLIVAAVEDVNGDGIIVRDGSGDEDGDGVSDIEEVREFGTDPCVPDDFDGDGLFYPEDQCPTEFAETPDGCPPEEE